MILPRHNTPRFGIPILSIVLCGLSLCPIAADMPHADERVDTATTDLSTAIDEADADEDAFALLSNAADDWPADAVGSLMHVSSSVALPPAWDPTVAIPPDIDVTHLASVHSRQLDLAVMVLIGIGVVGYQLRRQQRLLDQLQRSMSM